MKTLAQLNERPRRREWSGYVLELTHAVGGHAGTSKRTGTKVHLLRIETVVATSVGSKMKIGDVLYIEPVCSAAKHASVFEGFDTNKINCGKEHIQ